MHIALLAIAMWSVRYPSVDALQADTPAEPKPQLDAAAEQRLSAARARAQRALSSGLIRGDIDVTISEDDTGVVSVALSGKA